MSVQPCHVPGFIDRCNYYKYKSSEQHDKMIQDMIDVLKNYDCENTIDDITNYEKTQWYMKENYEWIAIVAGIIQKISTILKQFKNTDILDTAMFYFSDKLHNDIHYLVEH